MQKTKPKLNTIIVVCFLIIISVTGCTVDSFGIGKNTESYTRMNEQVKVSDLVDESRIVNWVLKKEDIGEFSIFDNINYIEKVMMNNSFAGLFRIVDSQVEMDLVKKVSVSETGREYIFELRESSWSNGDIVTAYDFINSWSKYNEKSEKSIFSNIGIDSVSVLDKNNISIKLFRSNDNLMHYLSDLTYRLYPDSVLAGAKLASTDNNITFSGKYEIRLDNDIESLKLIKNNNYYGSENHYINEVHIIPDEVFSENKNDRYEFYIDSSQTISEYNELLDGTLDFNYVASGVIKSLAINPKFKNLSDKYDRIKLFQSLDVKGVSDYTSEGLATVVDTFAVIDNWKFDYGYIEEIIIAKKNSEFDFDDIKIMYIDNSENQMIYEILSLMFSTNSNLNLISDAVSEEQYDKNIKANDFELMIVDIDRIGYLSDSYLLNLSYELPDVYDEYFDYNYYNNLKKYQNTSDSKYLKKAELSLKLNAYISPMYNCGFPIMGDERLDLKEFYNSEYLDFSTIKYN
ncbi:MAG: ABC transporter substrate-binding protein [Acidaminobacteraceae bacterium]